MNTELENFFKDTPLGIRSVLQAAVFLAEKVNSRTDLSGKEKTETIVKSMVEFLGQDKPELVTLVEAVVPGVLELVISTARGKYIFKQVTSCMPSCMSSSLEAKVASATVSPASVWTWVRSRFFRPASTPAVTIREATPVTA